MRELQLVCLGQLGRELIEGRLADAGALGQALRRRRQVLIGATTYLPVEGLSRAAEFLSAGVASYTGSRVRLEQEIRRWRADRESVCLVVEDFWMKPDDTNGGPATHRAVWNDTVVHVMEVGLSDDELIEPLFT